jgi:hypothetical protein
LPLAADEQFAGDEIGPALCFERLKSPTFDHLGSSPDRPDVAVFNRLTGVIMATYPTLIKPARYRDRKCRKSHSHPSVMRAADHAGA